MTAEARSALTEHLTAASAGPNPPPVDRLRAAAEYVIERAKPDQLILFGSASRGEFGPESDFDFLVVGPEPHVPRAVRSAKWTHPETGDEIDIIHETPEAVPKDRWLAGTVHAATWAHGATVFVAENREWIPTLRDQGRSPETEVKKGKYERNKAGDMLRRCRTRLGNADGSISEKGLEDWHTGCQNLQECCEKGLKALLIAHGQAFEYTHHIGDLLSAVRTATGEDPRGFRDLAPEDADLGMLSNYGRGGGYDAAQGAADPKKLFDKFRPVAAAFVEYIETRVPALLDEHDRQRREERKRG